jgi:hypothetical protein
VSPDLQNLALAYAREGEGWRLDMRLGNQRGGGGLLSTATDLLTWHEALLGGHLGAFVTGKLQERARLNNGRELGYARGLYVNSDRDGRRVWHTGGAGGYSAFVGGYPERRLAVASACNLDGGSSRAAAPVMNLFLPPIPAGAAGSDLPTGMPGVDPSGREGLYFSERTGQPLRLILRGGRLGVDGGGPLVAVAPDRFRNPRGMLFLMSQDEFELRFLSRDELELVSMEGETTRFRRARGWTPTPAELGAFAGLYESDEMGATWVIEAGEGELVARLTHAPENSAALAPVDRDTFAVGRSLLRFQRDASGRVVGMEYSNPMVRDLSFNRTTETAGGR